MLVSKIFSSQILCRSIVKSLILVSIALVLLCGVHQVEAQSTNIGYTGSLQTYTITQGGVYTITFAGGAGGQGSASMISGGFAGGSGAVISVTGVISAGSVLEVAVGQKGSNNRTSSTGGGGGGGGTFLYLSNSTTGILTPLLVAGGGGGGPGSTNGSSGAITNSTSSSGGTSQDSYSGGGGAGWGGNGANGNGNGGSNASGAWAGGLRGRVTGGNGGYGGGGGGSSYPYGGGGGGYSGGNAFDGNTISAGGGSSYWATNTIVTNGSIISSYSFMETSAVATNTTNGFVNLTFSLGNLYVTNGTTQYFETAGTNKFANTYVGYNVGDSNNALIVSGNATILTNANNLYIGYRGSSNSMVISNGGTVVNYDGYIGGSGPFGSGSVSNNFVLVSDPGSLWYNQHNIVVGWYASSNSLVVSNGATVAMDVELVLGYNNNDVSNSVTVFGNSTLTVGNRTLIGYSGGSFDSITVTGSNAVFTSGSDVIVGYGNGVASIGNSLVASNGGTVSITGDLYLGQISLDLSNTVTVSSNSSLIVQGYTYIGALDASSNSITITGNNALFTNQSDLYVGYGSSGGSVANALVVSNGGAVMIGGGLNLGNIASDTGNTVTIYVNSSLTVAGDTAIGNSDASSNTITITGNNALFTELGSVFVGSGTVSGSVGNSLVVSNGANVSIGGNLYLGQISPDVSNSVTVYDNSTLSVSGTTYIGSNSSSNDITVTGNNSVFTNHGNLFIGSGDYGSGGNALIVTNGGSVSISGNLTLGNGKSVGNEVMIYENSTLNVLSNTLIDSGSASGGGSNTIIVSGSNAVFNSKTISFGFQGYGDKLVVTNGASVATMSLGFQNPNSSVMIYSGSTLTVTNDTTMGAALHSSSNTIEVTGGGAIFNNGNNLYIGFTDVSNSMVISNGGHVVVGGNSYIGRTVGSSNNSVIVTGAGSLWSNGGSITIGYGGAAGNTLTITDGGKVQASGGIIVNAGTLQASVTNALGTSAVTLTNSGVLALSTNLTISSLVWSATSSSIAISNLTNGVFLNIIGALNLTGTGIFNLTGDSLGSGTTELMAWGSGSYTTNNFTVTGLSGGYTLTISNNNSLYISAASATPGNLYVGSNSSSQTTTLNSGTNSYSNTYVGYNSVASNNSLIISGGSTLLTNSADVYIGYAGSSNSMVISNGARVADSNGYIGYTNTSSNNSVTVNGGTWSNSDQLYVGYYGSGSLTIGSGTVSDATGFIGANSNSSGSVTMNGGLWSNTATLNIGVNGGTGSLTIGSGTVTDGAGYIGSSGRGSLTINGGLWSNSSYVRLGDGGTGSLMINGGTVSDTYADLALGYNSTGSVTMTAGLWNNSADLNVGNYGTGMMSISGGTVTDSNAYIGYTSNGIGSVTVNGGTSSNSDSLFVGYNGSGSLTFGSGTISDTTGYLGFNSGSIGLVTMTGGRWSNSADLNVGNYGTGIMTIGGGTISDQAGNIAYNYGTASVTVNGGTWTNSSELRIGFSGTGSLTINGGSVYDFGGRIGYWSNANGVVTINGGLWSNSSTLVVGYYGNGSMMIGGGTVTDTDGGLGNLPNTTSTVTMSGGLWSNSGNMAVGSSGTGTMMIGGGTVTDQITYVGISSSGNLLVISNVGTVISSGGLLTTNNDGSFVVGCVNTANSNTLIVTGSGASLIAQGDIVVSYDQNTGNQLSVLNGAQVTATNLYISTSVGGPYPDSSNNSVLISGAGSKVILTADTYVGQDGHNDSLVISSNGFLSDVNGWIGYIAEATNHSALVTGTGSSWSNSGTLTIGDQGSGTLTVANGGTVYASGISIASSNGSAGALNIGSLGGSDGAGSITAPTIAFGSGTGTINFNQINTASLTSSISGLGTIRQLGTGTTILSGNNTYTGTTRISAGNLQAASTNALGSSAVTLGGTSSTATLSLATNLTISSLIWSSNGVIAMTPGSQTLTISGAFTNANGTNDVFDFGGYSTAGTNTLITFGTNAGGSFTTNSFSVAGGSLWGFLLTSNSLSAWYISGGGGGVAPNTTNTGNTTYTSNTANNSTTVSSGTTTVSTGTTLTSSNSVSVLSGGTLVDYGTITTPILTLSGGGLLSMLGGTLNGNLMNNAGGTVSMDPSTINGNVTNAGTYISEGADVINGNVVNSGSFTMSGLTVNGTYNNSGSLTGFGTLNGNVTSSGTMTPSGTNSPIGTITINGNLTLQNGSTLVIVTTGTTNSSVNVSGATTLAGSLVIVPTTGTTLSYGQKIIFMSAASFSGSFSSVEVPTGFRGRIKVVGDPQLEVIMAPQSYTQLAGNRNQSNVATALNSFIPATSGDQLTVSTSLDSLTAGQYNQAFNAIMPTFYQQMATVAFNEANALNMELNQRLWGVRIAEGGGFSMNGLGDNYAILQEGQGDGSGSGGKGVLDAKKDILRPGLDNHWGMFVDGNGIFAQANSGNMLPGYNSESGGVTTGLTYKWSKNVATGIYTGYQGTYTKSGQNGSGLGTGSSLIDNAVRYGVFATYGQANGKGLYANALAGGAYHNYQATRVIQYTGINRTANSSPGAGELDSMLASGYDIQKGNFTFGPTASLQYTYLGVNSLTETGAQSLNFNSGGWNSSSMLSSVGAHAAYTWIPNTAHKDIVVVPQISLNWQHEFMQNPYAISGNLGGTSPGFSTWSSTPIRDFLYTGVGFTVEFAKKWNTSFFYNAAAGNSDLVSQNIFWSAGVKF
jgi:fibronectin-binding autotransporter adhesin